MDEESGRIEGYAYLAKADEKWDFEHWGRKYWGNNDFV